MPRYSSTARPVQWDYIIVGAGSAGCVLARRLSDNPDNKVLLVEAGGKNRHPWIRVPVGYFKTIGNPLFDWCYQTEPEPYLDGRQLAWPRGKGLGGSSAINGLIYVRGQAADFDSWGVKGWSYDDVLPYFKQAEHQERGEDTWHGVNGPQAVSDGRAQFAITDYFREAAINFGLDDNTDCNGVSQSGVGYYQTTTHRGWRRSAAHSYLDPIRSRSNLKVVTNFSVERLLIEQGRVCGVTGRLDGETITHRCQAEVLLCAGSIGSPHLLMLSGIGPAEQLSRHGIAVKLDVAGIGQGLQDHLKIHNAYRVSIPTLNDRLNSHYGKFLMGIQYALTRRGPLTMGAAPVFAFLHHDTVHGWPDIQFHVVPWSSDDPSKGFHPWSGFAVSICPIQPQSRGHIELGSTNPNDPPRIFANYLSDPHDCNVIVAGLRRAQEICQQPPLREHIIRETWPGPDLAQATDAELLDAIRQRVTTIFHPVGTVAMGDNPDAPLDSECRMRGISGLRVVDASVMPRIVSGNTHAAVTMIAEKVCDLFAKRL